MNASIGLQERTIEVVIEKDDDLYIATSPNLKGLVVANTDLERLKTVQIPQAIEQLFLHCEVDVIAVPIQPDNGTDNKTVLWYPVPFDFLEKKMDERRANQVA